MVTAVCVCLCLSVHMPKPSFNNFTISFKTFHFFKCCIPWFWVLELYRDTVQFSSYKPLEESAVRKLILTTLVQAP